jgi:peptidoglycan/xylan/chitin deacetylase (PgdA/CDA1 family)
MLTFDLEEFDIPEEYGQKVPASEQMAVTLQGMGRLLEVLDKLQVRATFFTTAHFASENPELIRMLAVKHEIASHAYYHSPAHLFEEQDIIDSKTALEAISGKKITGFRMPRLAPFDPSKLPGWGFVYDSSINPTYLPGRYNLLHKSPMPTMENGLIELPTSTVPWIRLPLFWLLFKNIPLSWYIFLCRITLKKRKNLMLYFHPWEFADIASGYDLPGYVKNADGEKLTQKLSGLITALLKQNAAFVTCEQFCSQMLPD